MPQFTKPPFMIAIPPTRSGRAVSIPTLGAGTSGVHYAVTFVDSFTFGIFGPADVLASLIHDSIGSGNAVKQDTVNKTYGIPAYQNQDQVTNVNVPPGEDIFTSDAVSMTQIPLMGCNKLSFCLNVQDTSTPGALSLYEMTLFRKIAATDSSNNFGVVPTNFAHIAVAQWGPFQGAPATSITTADAPGAANDLKIYPNIQTLDPFIISAATSMWLRIRCLTSTVDTNLVTGDVFFHS